MTPDTRVSRSGIAICATSCSGVTVGSSNERMCSGLVRFRFHTT